MVVIGIALAVIGELTWFALIPLMRFPAFVWLIAAGFALPSPDARALLDPHGIARPPLYTGTCTLKSFLRWIFPPRSSSSKA